MTGTLRSIPAGRSPFAADVQLSEDQTREVVAAVADALDGRDLTLEELDAAVVERTGAWAGDLVMPAFQTFWPRWRQAVSAAAQEGALVFGAGRGRKVSYTAPRNVDRSFAPDPAAEAIPAFLRGYLHAYGPATPAHLARWVGSSVDWASRAFEAGEVEPVLVDGTQAWVNAGDTDPHELGRSVLLLPYFDALAVGFFPREDLFPGRAGDRALARGQAGNYPVLLVDGVVRGVWHPKRSGSRVHVTVETWADLTGRRVRALEEQVARVGEILEGQADLTLGPVSVGPHA